MSGKFWRVADMLCADFERRLNSLLDQRQTLEDDLKLQLHAAECADCQQLLSGQARLLELVRYELTLLPDDFGERTVNLQVRPSRFSFRKAQIMAAFVATAATVLIVAAP